MTAQKQKNSCFEDHQIRALRNRNRLGALRLLLAMLFILAVTGCGWFADKPEMPLAITYRRSMVGAGYVVTFENKSTNDFAAWVTLIDKRNVFKREGGWLTVAANKTREIGWAEGWAFEQGDRVTVERDGYESIQVAIPRSFDY